MLSLDLLYEFPFGFWEFCFLRISSFGIEFLLLSLLLWDHRLKSMFNFSFLPLQDPSFSVLFSFSHLASRFSFFANQKHCASARFSLLCGDASVFASHLPKAFFFFPLSILRSCLLERNSAWSRDGVTQQSPSQVHNTHVYIFYTHISLFFFTIVLWCVFKMLIFEEILRMKTWCRGIRWHAAKANTPIALTLPNQVVKSHDILTDLVSGQREWSHLLFTGELETRLIC